MNSIINYITFGTDDASLAAFQFMLHEVRAEGQPLGSIDFNKLIPIPQDLNIDAGFSTDYGLNLYMSFITESAALSKATLFAPEAECSLIVEAHLAKWDAVEKKDPESWSLGEKAFQNIQKYGFPTWLEWVKLNWGTTENAYCCGALDKDSDIMTFQTSRTAVPKLAAELSKRFPKQELTYSWADGDTGNRLGRMIFRNGKPIETDILDKASILEKATPVRLWWFMEGSPYHKQAEKKRHQRQER